MLVATLAACLSALSPTLQESADRIAKLIGQLGEADLEAREEALEELINAGAPALPLLRNARDTSPDAEVKARAITAIGAIETAEALAKVYHEPRPVTLSMKDAPLAEVLQELSRQSGITIEGLKAGDPETITLALDRVPVLEALDRLCGTREKMSFRVSDSAVSLLREKHAPCPTSYPGPFRVRIAGLTASRSTNFQETTMTARVTLEADPEPGVRSFSRLRFQLTGATDDTSRALRIDRVGPQAPQRGVIRQHLVEPAMFDIGGFSAQATGIDRVKGTISASFAVAGADITIPLAGTQAVQEAGDFQFRVTAHNRNMVLFEAVQRMAPGVALPADPAEERLDQSSIVAIDTAGKEIKPQNIRSNGLETVFRGPNGTGERRSRYQLTFDSGTLKELRFRFLARTIEKEFAFEFPSIRLP